VRSGPEVIEARFISPQSLAGFPCGGSEVGWRESWTWARPPRPPTKSKKRAASEQRNAGGWARGVFVPVARMRPWSYVVLAQNCSKIVQTWAAACTDHRSCQRRDRI
jgi:hypothetical protein